MKVPQAIFELGLNHKGDVERALRMVDALRAQGATHLTIQAAIDFGTTTRDAVVVAKVQPNCLPLEQVVRVIDYGKNTGAVMGVAVLDPSTIPALVGAGAAFFKVLSSDISYMQLHRAVAHTGLPMYLSTGLATTEDIGRALTLIREEEPNADIRLIHTVLTIPTPREMLNLNNIPFMKETFGVPVAYGQHSDLRAAVPAALALGAETAFVYVAEERVPGLPDGPHAILCREAGTIFDDVGDTEGMLGSRERVLTSEEEARRIFIRRSIVAAVPIKASGIITEDILAFKRPGTGVAPWDFAQVIGSVAERDYLTDEDIKSTL